MNPAPKLLAALDSAKDERRAVPERIARGRHDAAEPLRAFWLGYEMAMREAIMAVEVVRSGYAPAGAISPAGTLAADQWGCAACGHGHPLTLKSCPYAKLGRIGAG